MSPELFWGGNVKTADWYELTEDPDVRWVGSLFAPLLAPSSGAPPSCTCSQLYEYCDVILGCDVICDGSLEVEEVEGLEGRN